MADRMVMTAQRKIEELYPRAPRYVIQIKDDHIVRFAHQPRGAKAMHTRIIDLSESGMAFIVPVLSAPQMDEKIKVEFSAPNCEAIACYAKVVRVQKHKSYNTHGQPQVFRMIAVEFQSLYEAQRKQLASGLTDQFKKNQKNYEWQQFRLKIKWFLMSLFFYTEKIFSRIFKFIKPKEKNIERNDQYIDD